MTIRSRALFTLFLLLVSGCGDRTGEFEYVAIGASDAVGIGASSPGKGYVERIQDGLKSDGIDVGLLKLGIPDADIEAIDEIETPVATREKPELVTIFVGANDIVEGTAVSDFQKDLAEMLSDLSGETDALVVIATIPDLSALPRFRDGHDDDVTIARVAAFNDVIRSQARSNGALIADLAAAPILDSEVSDDGFHPNDLGYRRIAEIFLSVIRANLAA